MSDKVLCRCQCLVTQGIPTQDNRLDQGRQATATQFSFGWIQHTYTHHSKVNYRGRGFVFLFSRAYLRLLPVSAVGLSYDVQNTKWGAENENLQNQPCSASNVPRRCHIASESTRKAMLPSYDIICLLTSIALQLNTKIQLPLV